ncbi:8819_t:CDS:2 [Funneliformis geosporum]|uniref:8819_t:CDS:1 n=1 Tax=Funneliformis geosporum TaxID=1117311 RepID=A0A9W4SLP9_9GLOM|nr:8819_t:CDS:2 [Funneliformis geosporum]
MHSVIGSGAFASVYYAYWKGTQVKFAIKKFADDCKEEIIPNEIRLMKKVDYHPNIIRFIGVVKFEDEINYSLILEYANGVIKLADFGYSVLRGSDFYTKASRGVIPYMDPKFLENHSYDLTEKSDIYSLGVLFWELTSCSSPFNFATTDGISIQLKILELIREKPITTTNGRFVKLYQKCWQHEPNERPEINQVISELNRNDECLKTEELNNEEIEKTVVDCDISRYDKN